MTVPETSIPTAMYTKYNKDTIMVMNQSTEVNHFFKKVYATTEHNQDLQDNMGTVLASIIERIERRSRLFNTLSDI